MELLKKYSVNSKGRDFVVGDMHGEYKKLTDALIGVDFNKSIDRLFSVGDLIDRGEESEKCLDLFYEKWFHSVRGNHEQMMFDAIVRNDGPSGEMWLHNGGMWYLDSDKDKVDATAYDLDKKLPYGIEVDLISGKTVGIVHAEVYLDDWKDNFSNLDYKQSLIWGRSRISKMKETTVKGVDFVFVGHTPVLKGTELGNIAYIDYGAVFSDAPIKLIRIDNL